MAEMHREYMMETMQDLNKDDFSLLKHLLNTKSINGKIIPQSKLEDADFMKVTNLLFEYHYPDPMQVLIEMLKRVPRNDLAEKLNNKVEAEKKKSEDQIDEIDAYPAKKPRLSGPYQGGYRLSDLEDYAANNQDQLIKQLEDHLEPNLMSKLKERLTQSKLKNSFVFTAKQCFALHSNQDLKEFLKKVSSAQKSQKLPQKILDILFSTIKSKNKRMAVEQKESKDNANSQLKRELQERPLREDRPATSSPAGSPPESELKNPWKESPANKETGSTPVPPNASSLELHDSDGENKPPELVYESKPKNHWKELPANKETGSTPVPPNASSLELHDSDGENKPPELVYESKPKNLWKELPANKETGSTPVPPNASSLELHDSDGENKPPELVYESKPKNPWKELPANKKTGSTPVPPNASSLELHDSDGENKPPELVYEKKDVLQPHESRVHPVEESQRCESKVPKAENSLRDEVIRKWRMKKWHMKKEDNCDFDYIGVCEHEKYGCFVAEDVIRFRSPGDTEYCLLRILQDKNELTRTGKLTKSAEFELQFNMAVMGAPSSDVISSVRDFFQVVPFDRSFTGFEEFFKDVVCKIVLPILALYKRVQVDLLQKTLDMHVKSQLLQKRL